MTSIAWNEDWNAFLDYLETCFNAGIDIHSLAKSLSGQIVHWRGHLDGIDLEGQVPRVIISWPTRKIAVDTEHMVTMGVISLPVADDATDSWSQASVGTEVNFSAQFLDKRALFPAIDVQILPSGKAIMLLGITGGLLT